MTKQELSELLESWENLSFMVNEIVQNSVLYEMLASMALYDKNPKSWRAAYLIDLINDKYPELMNPYLNRMVEQVLTEENDSKRRHFLKLISQKELSSDQQGAVFDFCLKTFTSSKEAVAVRVHAMQILYNISITEPELIPEVLAVIENEMENHPTPGIKTRGARLIKDLRIRLQR